MVTVCNVNGNNQACQPIPVPLRPPTDFLWQRSPFQLNGGAIGTLETAGIDYFLPYWMGRFYGGVTGARGQSAPAARTAGGPGSIPPLVRAQPPRETRPGHTPPPSRSLSG